MTATPAAARARVVASPEAGGPTGDDSGDVEVLHTGESTTRPGTPGSRRVVNPTNLI